MRKMSEFYIKIGEEQVVEQILFLESIYMKVHTTKSPETVLG